MKGCERVRYGVRFCSIKDENYKKVKESEIEDDNSGKFS